MSSRFLLFVLVAGLVITVLSVYVYISLGPEMNREQLPDVNDRDGDLPAPDEQIPLGPIDADAGVVLRPRGANAPLLSRLRSNVGMEEAKALVHDIPLKSPDRNKIPSGFDVISVTYHRSDKIYQFEDWEFTPETVEMLLWDRELGPDTRIPNRKNYCKL